MKKILVSYMICCSLSAFAQSYMILGNGEVLTVDRDSYVWDNNNFVLPYKVVTSAGQYFITNDQIMISNEMGYLFKYEFERMKVDHRGDNYLVTKNNVFYTVDRKGSLFVIKPEVVAKKVLRNIQNTGGRFFTVLENKRKNIMSLYTTSVDGKVFKLNYEGLNPKEIVNFGGNYFSTNRGTLYTLDKNGIIKGWMGTKYVGRMGGNYFFETKPNQKPLIYTIDDEGMLKTPNLPMSFNFDNLLKYGHNYIIDKDGNMYVIGYDGEIVERTSTTHDYRSGMLLGRNK